MYSYKGTIKKVYKIERTCIKIPYRFIKKITKKSDT